MSLDIDHVNQMLGKQTESYEKSINDLLDQVDPDKGMTTEQMLEFQRLMNKQSYSISCQSNTVKTIADAMKAVTQNLR